MNAREDNFVLTKKLVSFRVTCDFPRFYMNGSCKLSRIPTNDHAGLVQKAVTDSVAAHVRDYKFGEQTPLRNLDLSAQWDLQEFTAFLLSRLQEAKIPVDREVLLKTVQEIARDESQTVWTLTCALQHKIGAVINTPVTV